MKNKLPYQKRGGKKKNLEKEGNQFEKEKGGK